MKEFIRLGNELLTINYSELNDFSSKSNYIEQMIIDDIDYHLSNGKLSRDELKTAIENSPPQYKDADPVKAYWRGVWEDSAKNRSKDRWAQRAGQAAKSLSKRRKANKAARKARRHV